MQAGEGGSALAEELIELRRTIDRLELRFSELAARYARSDEWVDQGFVSALQWFRNHCHLSSGAASDRICVGRQLSKLRLTVPAVAAGEVGFAHLALVARTSAAAEEAGRVVNEVRLLEKAKVLNVGRFRDFCLHERHAADPSGFTDEQALEVESRFLEISGQQDGGAWLRGFLDREGAAILRTALEALAAGVDRTRGRRLADALVELAAHGLNQGGRPHLQVTASFETLKGLTGSAAGDLELSLPISSETVKRLACDCTLTRVLLDSDSVVIDVGRSQRVVSGSRRRALHARDRHCRFPGCDRPASWTDAHHIEHWATGGGSELGNLVLLCHRHHWLVHEGGWALIKKEDGDLIAIPPTASFNNWTRTG